MQHPVRNASGLVSWIGVAMLLGACSSEAGTSNTKAPPAPTKTGDTTQAYKRIIEGTWSLDPGTENPNFCVKVPITEDTYISAIRPVSPLGTHHTLLTVGTADDHCTSAVATGFIYAAGIGSEGITLPKGVALKLPAGKVLNLGLHIYNTGTTTLTGTSAMEVLTVDKKDVVQESDSVLVGPLSFTLPAHETTTISNECQLTADQSMYALFPHMHQLGTHIKTSVTQDGVTTVLHDADYKFNEQYQIPLDPILDLHTGDTIGTECTYQNTDDHDVTFGESSDTEMCFSVLFRYPKQPLTVCGGAAVNPSTAAPANNATGSTSAPAGG